MSNRTRQNNKGADRKMESNDSPEMSNRGETSEEHGLPSGGWLCTHTCNCINSVHPHLHLNSHNLLKMKKKKIHGASMKFDDFKL